LPRLTQTHQLRWRLLSPALAPLIAKSLWLQAIPQGLQGRLKTSTLKDISSDELSADAPANETPADRDARRECNRKRSERRRRLRDNFPVCNLAEALEAVESRVHTTPDQCLMSITAIARQAQGIRAGEVMPS
jgi:hypothetical protein